MITFAPHDEAGEWDLPADLPIDFTWETEIDWINLGDWDLVALSDEDDLTWEDDLYDTLDRKARPGNYDENGGQL